MMETAKEIFIGIGLIIILMIGVGTIYPGNRIPVMVYGTPNDYLSIETPLPPYAYLSDGVLKVEISNQSPFYQGLGNGLSGNSVYIFDGVFTITNNKTETGFSKICVTIISTTPWVAFFEGRFENTWAQTLEIEILANETTEIGMRLDTHNLNLGEHTADIIITASGGECG